MVVYSTRSVHAHKRCDEYWKLANHNDDGKYELQQRLVDHGWKVASSASKFRLLELTSRWQCGLLSYDVCSPKELRLFCVQRNIQIPTGSKTKKTQLVQALEDADKQRQFSRFTDLPPELRIQIYTTYFHSLGTLDYPTQPPLSKVSRMVRRESLPLFYATCRFSVHNFGGKDSILESKHETFFLNLSLEQCNLMRNFSVQFHAYCCKRYEMVEWTQGEVAFFQRRPFPAVTYDQIKDPSDRGRELANCIKGVDGKPGGTLLKLEDLAEVNRVDHTPILTCSRCGRRR